MPSYAPEIVTGCDNYERRDDSDDNDDNQRALRASSFL